LRRSLEGDISERKLRNAADDAGVRLSTADLKALTKSFEGRRDDIDGDKLQRAISKDNDSDDDDRVLKKLSKEVKRLNRKDPDYERVLRDFERDDGELSKKDFRKALERLGFELEDDEVDELAEKFGRRGVVKSRKFLEAVEKDREGSGDDDDKVTRACKGKEKKLKRAFEKVDEDEEGRVSRKKFSRVLEDVGVDLTSRDLESVMDKFEKRDKVDYGKFLKSIATDDDDDDVFGAIKSALKEAKDEGESPLKVFEKLDRDAAGELDADDVKRALKKLGYTPTAFELKKCKEKFPGKKEDVNYEDLVGELLGSKKKRRASSDSDDESDRGRSPSKSRGALKKLKKELTKLEERKGRRLKFDKYFEAYDSEGKDYVSERDFRKALQKLGVELDDDKKAFEACAQKWDKRGDGRIRWRDFVQWARDDSSSDERNPSRTRERRSRSRSRGRR
jgi:Ca2+-binding EF-hand superfamily protein